MRPRRSGGSVWGGAGPGTGPGGAVETCVGNRFGVRGAPGVRLSEDELAAVPGWAAHRVWMPRRDTPAHDPIRAHPGEYLDRQVFQQEGKAGCVISGVRNDEDVRVALLPLPGGDQSMEQITQLSGGDGSGVIPRGPGGVRPGVRSMNCGPARARRQSSTASRGQGCAGLCPGRRCDTGSAAVRCGRRGAASR